MSDYKAVFRELQYEVWKVAFLNAFLNAAIAFFLFNVLFTIIRERYIYSLVPAVIVFLWSFIRTVRRFTLRKIEEGNPEVAEILRTAHDNKSGDNLMIHALFLDLMQKMETVTAGVFISPQKTMFKIVAIALLAFTPILITSFAPFLMTDNPFAAGAVREAFTGADSPLAPVLAGGDSGEDRDIYGEKDVTRLGNDKLDITANSAPGGVDFTKTEDAQGKQFTYNDYPVDVQAEQTQAGTGGKESEATLINSYSNKTRSRT